ncbi:hypothetical protein KIN20_035644 [Parelaphostrongylus tenuis]|uniref:Uncharacterized protein n=1 Tax=Parelaphostrongylus tenuis TaxID=148309 RepID=A0AAD5RBH0_PARTN|nr:hypothetical protein KIN20_035644 [Parelaphostrongylus tenuis]
MKAKARKGVDVLSNSSKIVELRKEVVKVTDALRVEREVTLWDMNEATKSDYCSQKQVGLVEMVIIGNCSAETETRKTLQDDHIETHGLQWNGQSERLTKFIMAKTIQGNSHFHKLHSQQWA